MTNRHHSVFYTGTARDLIKRVHEHRCLVIDGFTRQYKCTKLVYFEIHEDLGDALRRERAIRRWRRAWKIELIEGMNPEWADLYGSLL